MTVAGPPPSKGMSTGAKVAIGCGILLVLVIVGLVIFSVLGGMFVKRQADQLTGGLEAQQEASETIQALEREHPFTAPADGIVPEAMAEQFLAVTNDAWDAMRGDMEELAERGVEIDQSGGQAGLGDAMAGVQALSRARVSLADALEEHEMPASAYLWTGMELVRAYHAVGMDPEQSGVPASNVALAERHRETLAEIADEGEPGRPTKGMVLGLAWTLSTDAGAAPAGVEAP